MIAQRFVSAITTVALLFLLTPVALAEAFMADFFEENTSGQAVYEDMVIGPQAVHFQGVTYLVYQGWLNAPFVTGFEHATRRWLGPFKVGDNPLTTSRNPLNTHGAPALHVDRKTGDLHVFWGAHGSNLLHAWTRTPGDISTWSKPTVVDSNATYPQVVSYETTGGITAVEVFYRTTTGTQPVVSAWASKATTGSLTDIWSAQLRVALTGVTEEIGSGLFGHRWYVTVKADPRGRVHLAAIKQPFPGGFFNRRGVFYMYREAAETRWRTISGNLVGTTETPIPSFESLSGTEAEVWWDEQTFENQVSLAVCPDGTPALLFLSGRSATGEPGIFGRDSHDWKLARWDASTQKWRITTIASTDHFFDAGALDFPNPDNPNHIEVFIVREGTRGIGTPERAYVDRGGEIWRYVSRDGGGTWDNGIVIRASDINRGLIYNDPQIVKTDDRISKAKARLLFCQWDNVADNFIHKVFLWGEEEGFAQREFLPKMKRLAGRTRIESAVSISQESFPLGAATVVITSGDSFADGISGIPLAVALNAPILFVQGESLEPIVAKEIDRLRGTRREKLNVIILGGSGAVASRIEKELREHPDVGAVRRIFGQDRYETSRNIAYELARLVGPPEKVFVASGERFPDALAISPIAASKGYPVLLNRADSLNVHTETAIKTLGANQAIVLGGPGVISLTVLKELNELLPLKSRRVWGRDRYATAAAISTSGLNGFDGIDGDTGVLSMDRFVLTSGESFPDALAGGVLAARKRGPIVLTQASSLPGPSHEFISLYGREVLTTYVLGGDFVVTPEVANQVAAILHERQHLQR